MTNILIVDFVIVLMIFLRITSAFVAAPIFGHVAIPATLKVTLALVISYMIFLTIDKTQFEFQINLYSLFFYGIKEIITGLIIGFSLNLIFYGISYAGSLIGIDIGLSMAEVVNPMQDLSNNVIGEIIYTGAILIFFIIDGHHYFLRGLAYSFNMIPIGKLSLSSSLYDLLIRYAGGVFIIAVKIASPILVSFFLIHIAEAIIARVIPQMQVFFVTQPLKLGIGFILLISSVPVYVIVIKNLLKSYEDNLFGIIKAMGS